MANTKYYTGTRLVDGQTCTTARGNIDTLSTGRDVDVF